MFSWLRTQLPNLLTLSSLFCGCLGIVMAFKGQLSDAALLMLLGGVFDFSDGFVARALGSSSELGAQLDSLSDMVTFGVLPGMILYALLNSAFLDSAHLIQYIPFLFPICAAIRLARFNISTEQTDKFIGLATPAAAFFVAGLPFISEENMLSVLTHNWIVLLLISVGLSILMISSLELFAFKLKDTSWAANKFKYVFLIISVLLLVLFKLGALPIIIILYILASTLENKFA